MGFLANMRNRYLVRRLILLLAVALLITLMVIILVLISPIDVEDELPPAPPEPENFTPTFVYEPEPEPEPAAEPEPENVINQTNETIEDIPEAVCIEPPLPELGCLSTYAEDHNIFGIYGLNLEDRNVKRTLNKIEDRCTGKPNLIDCIIDTAVFESENSWVCEWDCLEDMNSCEIYKMHLAVAAARQYVPPEDVFVARTENFQFYIMANISGDWIAKYKFTTSPVMALYNDYYYVGELTDVTWPEVLEVEPGDKFCFDVEADEHCVCRVEVQGFTVGDCPQLPADLRSICDKPMTEVFLNAGRNRLCFNVLEDAEEEFYTYKFVLTSGVEWIPAGNAFIRRQAYDCCVENMTFQGFLSVED